MVQKSGSSGQSRLNDPVLRKRRRKGGFFTPPVLLLLTAVLVALVGVLLIMTSSIGFFPQQYAEPIVLNETVTPVPIVPTQTSTNITPCSAVGRVYDVDDPSFIFQPECIATVHGNATLLYFDHISYPYYSVYGNTTFKAVNIQPVTVLSVDYYVPDVTVKKVIVDKEIIEKGILIDTTYKTVYVTYPDPEARCEIKIYDESRNLVAIEGFAGLYDTGMTDVITFLTQGNYTIEMTGKRIEFNVSIIEK
ncbi:hypothetical protein [uncultured Methanocorpusculum sp.]|nr:hypothetical protein [uncultured Methanocorpusculum sp.]